MRFENMGTITGEDLVRVHEQELQDSIDRARKTPLGKMIEQLRAKHEMLILTTPYGSSTIHDPNCKYCKGNDGSR